MSLIFRNLTILPTLMINNSIILKDHRFHVNVNLNSTHFEYQNKMKGKNKTVSYHNFGFYGYCKICWWLGAHNNSRLRYKINVWCKPRYFLRVCTFACLFVCVGESVRSEKIGDENSNNYVLRKQGIRKYAEKWERNAIFVRWATLEQ